MLAVSPFIPPCLPRLRSRPPAGKDWLHEVKFDGCRVQLHKMASETAVYSGQGTELTCCRTAIDAALKLIPTKSVVLDGELVVGSEGSTMKGLDAPTTLADHFVVYCFDLLALNGKDLRPLPLLARKEKLAELLGYANCDVLCYSDLFTDAKRLLAACAQDGIKAIISKHVDSCYRSGRGDWIEVNCRAYTCLHAGDRRPVRSD
jgi:bifunctional non-homologous end joining protein LigD